MKKILIIIVVIVIISAGYLYFYKSNQITNMADSNNSGASLTAEQIVALKVSSNNPDGDYFIGTPDEQKKLVDAFVADNSRLDSIYMYIAADTAFKIGDIKDAGFLFYGAQIRKAFDYKRFDLGDADGNNVQTYLGFLNETVGGNINPAVLGDSKSFIAAIDMLDAWNVVPADDAVYALPDYQKAYGTAVIPKDQWQVVGTQVKKGFMDNFGNKYRTFLSDPKNVEIFKFVQDYNFGKIPHNAVNDAQFKTDSAIIKNL